MKNTLLAIISFLILSGNVLSDSSESKVKIAKRFLETEEGKVWYKISGSRSEATPLLVVHGGPGVSSVYLTRLNALSSDRPVILYDQLGCGKSVHPQDSSLWTNDYFLKELDQVRRELNLEEVYLYGHSWGAILVVQYALKNQAIVKGLILSGPPLSFPMYRSDLKTRLLTLPDSVSNVIFKYEKEGNLQAEEYQSAKFVFLTNFFARKQPWSDNLNSAFATMNKEMYNYMLGPELIAKSGTLADLDLTDQLGQIETPTMIIVGEYDTVRPETAKFYQSLIKGSELAVQENCGHLTIHDNPDADLKVIKEFISKIEKE